MRQATYNDIANLHAQGLTPEQIETELRTNPPVSWYRTLSSREALAWLGQGGRYIALQEAANNEALPVELRGACAATLIVVQRADVALDFSPGSEQHAMLVGCEQAGVFDANAVGELIESCRTVETPTVEQVARIIQGHKLDDAVLAARSAYARGEGDAAIVAAFQGAMA